MLLINRTLLKMAKGLWRWIFLITALKMVSLVGVAIFAKTISRLVGEIDHLSLTMQGAMQALGYALLVALLVLVSDLLIGEAEYRCTAKARRGLRNGIMQKILELDVGQIERIGPSSAITSAVDGVEAMQVYYSKYLPGLLYCLLAPIYLFYQLQSISLPIAGMLLAIGWVLLPINNLFRSHIERLKGEYWDSLEDLTQYYLESVQGLVTFKLFLQDHEREKKLAEKSRQFNLKIMDVMKVNFSSFLVTDGLIYTGVTLAGILSYIGLQHGIYTFADALMIFMLSSGFFTSYRQLMNTTHTALAGVAATSKVDAILSLDASRRQGEAGCLSDEQGIILKEVDYAYPGRQRTLSGINLHIPKGKVTAIVGLSGCGKSTLAGLLMRFFDPQSGSMQMDGRDYFALSPQTLREHLVMVPQSVSLFSGTMRENLCLARPDATDEELWESLRLVRLDDWVSSLPEGLDESVGDAGAKLSGGQKQKIGIARALLCEAEYIIFDEATSSVDLRSENEIWQCINELAKIRTLIIISHRLSTIAKADQIVVMQDGRIVDCADHVTLMQHGGLYWRLVNEQAALEKRGGLQV